jgi:hypothetical protein
MARAANTRSPASILFRGVLVQEEGQRCGAGLGERRRVAGEGGRSCGEGEAAEGLCRRRDQEGRGGVGERRLLNRSEGN